MGQAVSVLEFNLMRAKLDGYEKSVTDMGNRLIVVESDCHCHHVDTLTKEMAQVRIDIVNMQARGAQTAGASADGGADSRQHADQLLQRVVQLEAAMMAAETAWKTMGGDAWSQASAAAAPGAAKATSEQPVNGSSTQSTAPGMGLSGGPTSSWPNRDAGSWHGGGGAGGHGPGGGGGGGGGPHGG